jgi:conjugal transfer pilus assembly protein TraA
MTLNLKRLFMLAALSLFLFSAVSGPEAFAGTGGTEFSAIYDLIKGWAQGTLGKVIALGMFLVGVAAGVVQQSIVAAVVGIGGALVMYYGPAVIEGVVSMVV